LVQIKKGVGSIWSQKKWNWTACYIGFL